MAGADATIRLTADATGVKAAINDAKTSLQQLKDAAKGAGEELNAGTTKYLQSLEKQARALELQAATFGKSKAEAAEYLSSLLGVSATAASMVERIDASEKALARQALAAKAAAEETARLAAAQASPGKFLNSLEEQAGALERQSKLFGKTTAELAAFEAAECCSRCVGLRRAHRCFGEGARTTGARGKGGCHCGCRTCCCSSRARRTPEGFGRGGCRS